MFECREPDNGGLPTGERPNSDSVRSVQAPQPRQPGEVLGRSQSTCGDQLVFNFLIGGSEVDAMHETVFINPEPAGYGRRRPILREQVSRRSLWRQLYGWH